MGRQPGQQRGVEGTGMAPPGLKAQPLGPAGGAGPAADGRHRRPRLPGPPPAPGLPGRGPGRAVDRHRRPRGGPPAGPGRAGRSAAPAQGVRLRVRGPRGRSDRAGALRAGPGLHPLRNVDGTLELARQLAGEGVVPVFFSTDLVFDGQDGRYIDDAPTRPLNEYGAQKAEVEQRLPEVCGGRCLVIRLGKVFGLARGDGTLLDEMAGRLTKGQEVAAARDQVFSPVLVGDVVRAVLSLQAVGVTGVVNLQRPEVWSRFDLGRAVARRSAPPPRSSGGSPSTT